MGYPPTSQFCPQRLTRNAPGKDRHSAAEAADPDLPPSGSIQQFGSAFQPPRGASLFALPRPISRDLGFPGRTAGCRPFGPGPLRPGPAPDSSCRLPRFAARQRQGRRLEPEGTGAPGGIELGHLHSGDGRPRRFRPLAASLPRRRRAARDLSNRQFSIFNFQFSIPAGAFA
jgi:hypothetical protein